MLDFFTSPYFLFFARLCVGGVFLVSSIGKLLDKPGTEASMARYPFLPRGSGKFIANYFPYLELLVGLALVLGIFTRLAAFGAVALFALFTVLIMYDLSRGEKASCHCFGKLSDDKLTPMAVVRNVALMALAVIVAASFDGWLSIDAALAGSSTGVFGLIARAMSGAPSAMEAVPVGLLAVALILIVVFGGQAVSMVRNTLRGMGFR